MNYSHFRQRDLKRGTTEKKKEISISQLTWEKAILINIFLCRYISMTSYVHAVHRFLNTKLNFPLNGLNVYRFFLFLSLWCILLMWWSSCFYKKILHSLVKPVTFFFSSVFPTWNGWYTNRIVVCIRLYHTHELMKWNNRPTIHVQLLPFIAAAVSLIASKKNKNSWYHSIQMALSELIVVIVLGTVFVNTIFFI